MKGDRSLSRKFTLDTQTKLLLILFANFLTFFQFSLADELISVAFLLLITLIVSGPKRTIIYSGIYLSCVAIEQLLIGHYLNYFVSFFSLYAVTLRRLLPLLLVGGLFIATTKVSELTYTLRKWQLPEFIVVPFSVLFRFFPTLKGDYQHIRSAMRLRGIAVTNTELFKHPIQTLEYIVVPLLMSATATATDLSAAALTRGISNPTKHTTIYPSGLKLLDYLVLGSALGIIILRGVR